MKLTFLVLTFQARRKHNFQILRDVEMCDHEKNHKLLEVISLFIMMVYSVLLL